VRCSVMHQSTVDLMCMNNKIVAVLWMYELRLKSCLFLCTNLWTASKVFRIMFCMHEVYADLLLYFFFVFWRAGGFCHLMWHKSIILWFYFIKEFLYQIS
jgi:hypothetical protein